MPKISFRMAPASRESVCGGQTSTARTPHRSGHTEGQLATTPADAPYGKDRRGRDGMQNIHVLSPALPRSNPANSLTHDEEGEL